MTSAGLLLVVSSATMAGVGVAAYALSRHAPRASRGALLALFSHGAFATAGILFAVTFVHVHSLWPLVIHIHGLLESLHQTFDCDLSLDCVAVSSALVAAIVLGATGGLSQLVSRRLLRRYGSRRLPASPLEAAGRGLLPEDAEFWLVRDPVPDAFAIALLRFPHGRPRIRDVIVVTTALLDLVREDEMRAVLAHEVAHVRAGDDRYLPVVRTLSRLLFLDPVLRLLSRRLVARYEFGADEDAAREMGDPRPLARALLRLCEASPSQGSGASLWGSVRGPSIMVRIERLLRLADEMGLPA